MGAQIRATLGGPAAAQIQVVPTDRGMELLPGTMVHLFYLDSEGSGFEQRTDGGKEVSEKQVGDNGASDLSNKDFKLIFHGELAGFHFVKQPGMRSLVLQCLDSSKIWDTTFQYMINAGARGNLFDNAANFAGAGDALISVEGGGEPTFHIASLLLGDGAPSTPGLENTKGLLSGLIRMLEAVGGVRGSSRGINDYTTIAEMLSKTLFQIAADQDDSISLKLLDATSFERQLTGALQQLGGRVSLRDIIRLINSFIHYNVAPNPAPLYTEGTAVGGFTAYEYGATVTLHAPERLHPDLVAFWTRLNAMAPPDGAKWVAGHSTRSGADQASVFRKGYSKARPGQSPHNYDKSLALDVLVSRNQKISNDPADYKIIGELAEEMGLTWGGNWTSFVDMPHVQVASWRQQIGSPAQVGEDDMPEGLNTDTTVKRSPQSPKPTSDEQVGTPQAQELTDEDRRSTARMLTQIFRPDVWYVPPPRCNVFFPENYASFSYSRNYLQEFTRLQLRTGSEILGQTGFQQDTYYAPMIKKLQEELKTNGQLDEIFLMPHEKFTGIIPEMQSMDDVGFFLKKLYDDDRVSGEDKNKFAQQTAAYNFFKARFSSRTMSVSGGPFTPFPVVGFPALIIQKGIPPVPEVPTSRIIEMINDGDVEIERGFLIGGNRFHLPTQFLGMVESVDHSITQAGGSTSLVLSHARAHRSAGGADDEFLNHLIERVSPTSTKVEVTTVLIADKVIAEQDFEKMQRIAQVTPQGDNPTLTRTGEPRGLWHVGSVGPQGGKITRVETSGQLIRKDIATALDQTEFTGVVNYYSEVKIVEEVEGDSKQRDDLKTADVRPPVEMVLAPPWVPDLYSNEQIGETIYQPFFGTGSIVDEQSFRKRAGIAPGSGTSTPESDLNANANEGEIGALSDLQTTSAAVPDSEVLSLIHAQRQVDAQQSLAQQEIVNQVSTPATASTDPNRGITLEEVVDAKTGVQAGTFRSISIAQAVDTLSTIYGSLRAQDTLDVHRFIHRYTYRPIINMDEVLGHPEFELDVNGEPVKDAAGKVKGFEGFHSRAVSGQEQLKGLLLDPAMVLPSQTGQHDKAAIDPAMDPRRDRRERVVRYMSELTGPSGSRGLLG